MKGFFNSASKYISTFFIILYLFVMIQPFSPYIEYLVNYEYISKVLCINKDKPEMKCNGKCHLKKLLNKNSEKSALPKQTNIENKNSNFDFIVESNRYAPLRFCNQIYFSISTGQFSKVLKKVPTPPPRLNC
ncbi:MAG: hypothetical protein JEY94_09425 [Melioribacteraceae bacterium]|nr:hypothetical protein [Melioribacteraceae bacterium]